MNRNEAARPGLAAPSRWTRPPVVATCVIAALALAGCADMSPRQQGTAQGAAIGAVAGALIGSATGGRAGSGALVGAAAGAAAGNLWSKRMEDKQRAMEQATHGSGVQVTRTADDQLKLQVPSDISFAVGSAALEPRLRPVLDAFAAGLDRDRGTLVRVVGHTDNTGSDAINEPLSLRRAESVRSYLEDRGIKADRIEVSGRGSREPVVANDSAEDRARNRRVEIFLREPKSSGY
jgi:outer membrane protein OmpA-like peptidoglycan-associated protein